jgi:signal transduction histidine kinase
LYQHGEPKRELADLNEVIRDMKVLLSDAASRNSVSIRTMLDPALPSIAADRIQMQQVLVNLMLNGIEAMQTSGGELIVVSGKNGDGEVLVSVRDSGVGLPGNGDERIFRAFFTTKPHGTGMGLSICRRIIEAHGGRLWASPNAERGATFQFTLPST